MITVNSPWHCGTRITEDQFVAEIDRRGALTTDNPVWRGVDPEQEARAAYRLITAYPGESAELWLEIPQHEHTWGKNRNSVLHRNDTASVTNARSVRLKRLHKVPHTPEPPMAGTYQIVRDSQRKSDYGRYARALDSFEDGIERVRDPNYAYKDARTIGEVIAIFAPGEDENDPEGYAQAVADGINATRARYGAGEQEPDMPTIPKPAMVSRPSPNRGGYALARVPEAIVNHIATSTLTSNLNWLTNPASGASCNYYIAKDGTIYELVPWQEAAWTNGVMNKPDLSNALIRGWFERGWNPNPRTVTIEHEGEASDTLTSAQIVSNNKLTAWLHQETGIPIDRDHILGHYQIDGLNRPYCPSFSDGEWVALVNGARALVNAQPEPAPTPDPTQLPAVPDPWRDYAGGNPYGKEFWIPQPFVDWIEEYGGFWTVGFVYTGAFIAADTGLLTQFFEGAALEFHPDEAGTEYEVMRRHLGVEVVQSRYPDHAPKKAA